MTLRCSIVIVAIILPFCGTFGQDPLQDLSERDSRINELYKQEKYRELILLIDRQIDQAQGTTWQDSLYQYTYKFARAHWKVNGVEAGVATAERVCNIVRENDPDPVHAINALADLSWLHYEVGNMRECYQVDSLAMTIAESAEGVSDRIKGQAHHYLGFDLTALGDHAAAIDHFLRAIEIYENADSLMPMELAESHNGAGSANWHMGRNKQAEQHYLKSLKWLGDSEDPVMLTRKASAVGNLALLWEDAGDLTKSKEYYRWNLALNHQVIAESEDPLIRDEAIYTRSRSYTNMAALYHALGDMGTSRRLLDLAQKDRAKVLEPGDPKLLMIKDMYSDLERSAGDLERAEQLLDEYLAVCEKVYGPSSKYSGRALGKKATITAERGDHEQAQALFAEAIDQIARVTDEDSDPELAKVYLERSYSNYAVGDHASAVRYLGKARGAFTKAYGEKDRWVAQCDIELSKVYQQLGDTAAAERSIEQALDILTTTRGDDQSDAIPSIRSAPHLLPDAIHRSVQMERALGKGNKEAHLDRLQQAIDLLEKNKTALRDEESRLLLLGAQQKVFHLAQHIAYELYESAQNEHWANTLFDLSERNRSILLKSRLNEFTSLSFVGVPDSLLEKEAQLLKALSADVTEGEAALALTEKERVFKDLLATLESDHPKYFAMKYGDQRVTIKQLQEELLEAGQSVLAYSLTGDQLFIFAIGKDRHTLLRVPAEELGTEVFALNQAMVDLDDTAYQQHAGKAYELVFAPVQDLISTKHLLIIPDEELHFLNFEVLQRPAEGGEGKLLVEDHTISYLLSATTALQFKQLDKQYASGALAMAPGFSDEMKSNYLSSLKDSTALDEKFLNYIQQPFAVQSAQELGRVLQANVMLGADASESQFKQLADDHGIIHLGTHTEINSSSPLYSRLVLSKEHGPAMDEDGYLHAHEIYAMQLNAELAVLTACETGTGKQYSAEGVRSLAHSFAYAGCPSLVMSLWKIDEKTSSQIISSFYEHLAKGTPKNEALRQAKLDYLKDAPAELRAPYYWAGVVLVGDVDPVQLSTTGMSWWMWVLGVAVVVLLIVLVRRR